MRFMDGAAAREREALGKGLALDERAMLRRLLEDGHPGAEARALVLKRRRMIESLSLGLTGMEVAALKRAVAEGVGGKEARRRILAAKHGKGYGGWRNGNKGLDAPESHSQDVEVRVSQDISIHVKIKG